MLLTNADLDHTLGLLALREGAPLQVYATAAVRNIVAEGVGLSRILDAFCGASWLEPPLEFAPLGLPGTGPEQLAESQPHDPSSERTAAGRLWFRAIPLTGNPPPFARNRSSPGVHSVAYQFLDNQTGGRLLVAPDVAGSNEALDAAISDSDAVLLDGTFWSGDELGRVKSGASSADEMGHVTIRESSLEWLRKSAARHKIYIHINNTNPILAPDSPERAAVEAAGVVVGADGLEFEL